MSVAQKDYERKGVVSPRSVWLIVDVDDPFGDISNEDALEELIQELDNAVQSWKEKHRNLNRTPRPSISRRSGVVDTEALHVMKRL